MPLTTIQGLVKADLAQTNKAIFSHVNSDIPMVNDMIQYMLDCGGKRVRPMLLLLAARALHCPNSKHVELAAVIEMIHTASLMHDDVVDRSVLRRGRKAAHLVWNTQASILVGDFLYLRAFEIIVNLGHQAILSIFSETTQLLAQGELLQLNNCNNPDTTEAYYFEVIKHKTAKLFEMASQFGALIATESERDIIAMRDFGLHLGMAYQLVDDVLDYSQPAEETGKTMGQDLAEGKMTLPLIHAKQKSKGADLALIQEAIKTGSSEHIKEILGIIESTEAIKYTSDTAKQHATMAKEAIAHVVDSPYRAAMLTLADFVVERSY